MNKLNYIFLIDDVEQTNVELEYQLNDNKITFTHNNENYTIDFNEETISKVTEEGTLTINIPNKTVELILDKVGNFDVPFLILSYTKNKEIFDLEYYIEAETPIKNHIIIKLI